MLPSSPKVLPLPLRERGISRLSGQTLLDRHGLGEVTRLVHVAAAQQRDVVGQQLQRHSRKERLQQLGCLRDEQRIVHLGRRILVALGQDGHDCPVPRLHFLDVAQRLVAQDVAGGQGDGTHSWVDEGDGAVLHLAGRVALGVNVADFLELQGAFGGDGRVGPAAQEEEVVIMPDPTGQVTVTVGLGQYLADESGAAGPGHPPTGARHPRPGAHESRPGRPPAVAGW